MLIFLLITLTPILIWEHFKLIKIAERSYLAHGEHVKKRLYVEDISLISVIETPQAAFQISCPLYLTCGYWRGYQVIFQVLKSVN